jgi:ABC-type antimicrobial peptide transport system permease subunit
LSDAVGATPDAEQRSRVYSVAAIGLLIVLVASINFVNLLTALGVRRALEVGVRKAVGARRSDLFAQFMSESFLYVGVGAVVGVAIGCAALRPLNAFLRRTIDFSLLADWRVIGAALLFLTVVALLAGVYPAAGAVVIPARDGDQGRQRRAPRAHGRTAGARRVCSSRS